jgi:hypothetical protein
MSPGDVPPVYRAPMRSRRDDVDPVAGVRRALALDLCGIGGAVDPGPGNPVPDDLPQVVHLVARAHGEPTARRLARFAAIPAGAYVWTRDRDGAYRLGRLTGPWRYDHSAAAREADLVHVRDCVWLPDPVPEPEVPAGTLRSFARGGRNLQQTHDRGIGEQTLAVWRAATTGPLPGIPGR